MIKKKIIKYKFMNHSNNAQVFKKNKLFKIIYYQKLQISIKIYSTKNNKKTVFKKLKQNSYKKKLNSLKKSLKINKNKQFKIKNLFKIQFRLIINQQTIQQQQAQLLSNVNLKNRQFILLISKMICKYQ